MRLHHIGIATKDIEETKKYLANIFDSVSFGETIFDPKQNTYLCMLTMTGGENIELIQGDKINNFVDKKQYLYHTCYEVDDIDKTLEKFHAEKDLIFMKPVEAVLFEGRRVAFVLTKMGILELLEATNTVG